VCYNEREERVGMGKFTYNDAPNMGFTIEFDNSYIVSVQWATTNYCGNKLKAYPDNTCSTAEVMVIDPMGNEQEPIGWLSPDKVSAKLQEIASITTKKKWSFWF
jgi:hypothetical protein